MKKPEQQKTFPKNNSKKHIVSNFNTKETPLTLPIDYSNATESLMPELEELIKKNPNILIGCGG
ncbi:MAG TPA: hypothetical protein PKM51_04025 [Chitinophagales bacterium]|nr:hypothetical protein [Chitinophagales bacterium]HNM31894.1 hypothetical protein [Chitinophagales bacterium]